MKVLVVGSLPPPLTERSRSLLAAVLSYRRQGADVVVLSPSAESVAHENLVLSGPAASVEIARAARGADVVVVQLQPGLVVDASSSRAGRALGLGGLGVALRGVAGEVVLRLHSIHDIPLGVGGRAVEGLWAAASRIEVGDDDTRKALSAAFGPELAAKIVLAGPPADIGGPRRGQAADVGPEATLETVTAMVRARAAADRAAVLGTSLRGSDVAGSLLSLGEWLPREGAGVPAFVLAQPASLPAGPLARRVARAALVAAEDWPPTRPLARGARATRRLLARL